MAAGKCINILRPESAFLYPPHTDKKLAFFRRKVWPVIVAEALAHIFEFFPVPFAYVKVRVLLALLYTQLLSTPFAFMLV